MRVKYIMKNEDGLCPQHADVASLFEHIIYKYSCDETQR